MKIGNVIIDKKIFMTLLIIFVVVTGFVGYSYLNSDLSSALALNVDEKVCVQENLNDRLRCLSNPDNMKSKYVTNSNGVDFSSVSSDTNGKGLYMLSSTIGDTYPISYYRGAVTNNNVKFGGYCWKIVRTTETGGTKLIYNGVPDGSGYCTGANPIIDTSAFNTLDNSISYAGYTYTLVDKIHQNSIDASYVFSDSYNYTQGVGFELVNPTTITDITEIGTKHYTGRNDTGSCSELSFVTFATDSTLYNVRFTTNETIEDFILRSKGNTVNSTIKDVIDNWYTTNSINSNYLENTIFCGDRSKNNVGSDSAYLNSGWQSSNANISNHLYYKNYGSLNINNSPSLECTNTVDKYSTSSNALGNGYLSNSIALLSMDEVMLAGGVGSANATYYLKSDTSYWTMSPRSFNRADIKIFSVDSDGSISSENSSEVIGVRPVVSLRHEVVLTGGDGSTNNPYTVDLPLTPTQLNNKYADRFTTSYDESSLSLNVTVNTDLGWEYLVKPLSVKKGKTYRITLDYTILNDYNRYATYNGIGLQVVDSPYSYISGANGSTGSLSEILISNPKYMPLTAGTYSGTIDFTAGSENYFIVNCGMADDNQTINFKISNFSIREI